MSLRKISISNFNVSFMAFALVVSATSWAEQNPQLTREQCLDLMAPTNGKLINSGKLKNPCNSNDGYFIWGSSSTKTYDCVQSVGGWVPYVAKESTTIRAIYSSSGPNRNGTVFCSARAYEKSVIDAITYVSITHNAANGTTLTTFYRNSTTKTTKPIEAPYSPAWVSAYGIPKYWDATLVTVKIVKDSVPAASPPDEWYDYQVNTVENWEWAAPL